MPEQIPADGAFFAPLVTKKIPGIPVQRAFILWKDNTERLIVQSSLKGEGDRFAWILPLPSVPTSIETVTPGFLDTLALNTGPDIVHEKGNFSLFWTIMSLFMGLAALGGLALRGFSFGGFLLLMLVGIIFAGIATPNFLGAGLSPVPGPKVAGAWVEKSFDAGGYTIDVVNADSAGALDEWLTRDGFTAPGDAGQSIVEGLIREGWRFAAIRFTRPGDGFTRPDPLAITFPASTPVYPMRLTALAGTPVYVELFVAGDREAVVSGLERELCDVLDRGMTENSGWQHMALVGRHSGISLAHPSCDDELAPGSVFTRFAGVVTPQDMNSDLEIAWREPRLFRLRYYSDDGARESALVLSGTTWCGGIFLVLLVSSTVRKGPRGDLRFDRTFPAELRRRIPLLAAFVVVALLAVGVREFRYMSLDRREVVVSYFAAPKRSNILNSRFIADVKSGPAKPEEIQRMSGQEIADRIATYAENPSDKGHPGFRNAVTGQPLRQGDSPGDYMVIGDERGIVLRIFLRDGYPRDTVLRPR